MSDYLKEQLLTNLLEAEQEQFNSGKIQALLLKNAVDALETAAPTLSTFNRTDLRSRLKHCLLSSGLKFEDAQAITLIIDQRSFAEFHGERAANIRAMIKENAEAAQAPLLAPPTKKSKHAKEIAVTVPQEAASPEETLTNWEKAPAVPLTTLPQMQVELAKAMEASPAIFDAAATLQHVLNMQPRTEEKKREQKAFIRQEMKVLQKLLRKLGEPQAYADCILSRKEAKLVGCRDIGEVWAALPKNPLNEEIAEPAAASAERLETPQTEAPAAPDFVKKPAILEAEESVAVLSVPAEEVSLPVSVSAQEDVVASEQEVSDQAPVLPEAAVGSHVEKHTKIGKAEWHGSRGGNIPSMVAAGAALQRIMDRCPKVSKAADNYKAALIAEGTEQGEKTSQQRKAIVQAYQDLEKALQARGESRLYAAGVKNLAEAERSGSAVGRA